MVSNQELMYLVYFLLSGREGCDSHTQHALEFVFFWRLCCKILLQPLFVQGGDDSLWKLGINYSSDCDNNNEAYFLLKCRLTSVYNYIFLNDCSVYLLPVKFQTWVLREDVQAEIQMRMVFGLGDVQVCDWGFCHCWLEFLQHPGPAGWNKGAQSLTPILSWPVPACGAKPAGWALGSSSERCHHGLQRIHLKFCALLISGRGLGKIRTI